MVKDYYFLLSSVTSAMKGEKLLLKNGFRAYVFRDGKVNPYGCGYVIKVRGDKEKLSEILKNGGVRVNEIREVKL